MRLATGTEAGPAGLMVGPASLPAKCPVNRFLVNDYARLKRPNAVVPASDGTARRANRVGGKDLMVGQASCLSFSNPTVKKKHVTPDSDPGSRFWIPAFAGMTEYLTLIPTRSLGTGKNDRQDACPTMKTLGQAAFSQPLILVKAVRSSGSVRYLACHSSSPSPPKRKQT